MKTPLFLGLSAIALTSAFAPATSGAAGLKLVNFCDSTTYVRVNDPDTVALTLDIKTDYTFPAEGIAPANLIKMSDMLMSVTGVNYDVEGYPSPSDLADYDGGKWVPATPANSAAIAGMIDSDKPYILTQLWSEEPVIKPLYNDNGLLSMLASNYVYTGGAHGMYFEYCVNYSVRDQKFVYLKDLLPGLDTPEGKKLYEEKLVPVLTQKAKEYVTSDPEVKLSLLVDKVNPTGNFAFTKDGIVLRYQPYEIAPWAAGVVEVPLSYEEIDRIVKSVK